MTEQGSAIGSSQLGASLLRAVQIMDRLRSPGGCPWDAAQTHRSLAPYLIEEAYETLEAIESADPVALREELGDLLLQVLFHARLAAEAEVAFDIDDVAGDLVDKLIRRHPHVFADVAVDSAAEVNANWETIKQLEKQRNSVTDGIPTGQPALSYAAKLIGRSRRAGLSVPLGGNDRENPDAHDIAGLSVAEDIAPRGAEDAAAVIGQRLLAVVGEAVESGIDPELALRASAQAYGRAVRGEETARKDARTQQ